MRRLFLVFCFLWFFVQVEGKVTPGVNVFFEEKNAEALKGKRIGLITNQTGVDQNLRPTLQLLLESQLQVVAVFSPEHGLQGEQYAEEKIAHGKTGRIPIYSLHGETRRPTEIMLKDIDVLIYDIQCVGARAYTFPTTLFYAMEEAAKRGIEVIVFDRPNPINGLTIDGPMLDEKWRSYIGYVNVPYCHGMTIGELARFFNGEYKVECQLKVIPMRGWKRSMTYRDTGLTWIPPSPNIPEDDTPLVYSSTGILSGLKLLNVGVGYTLPFKIVGAPWVNAKQYAAKLNEQKLPGVRFLPFYFKPFYGLYKGESCQGVLIRVIDTMSYRPVSVQYALLGILKSMYPKEFAHRLSQVTSFDLFHQANGTDEIYRILTQEKYATWKLVEFQKSERKAFEETRKKYLISAYPKP